MIGRAFTNSGLVETFDGPKAIVSDSQLATPRSAGRKIGPPEETAPTLRQLRRECGDGLWIFGGNLHVGAELGNVGG